MEIIGWVGTTLVIIAYGPQIHHLWAEKCAWGISLFMVSQRDAFYYGAGINILATAATILLTQRSNQICPYHTGVTGRKSGQ